MFFPNSKSTKEKVGRKVTKRIDSYVYILCRGGFMVVMATDQEVTPTHTAQGSGVGTGRTCVCHGSNKQRGVSELWSPQISIFVQNLRSTRTHVNRR